MDPQADVRRSRAAAGLASLLFFLALAASSPARADFVRGDANRDGRIDVSDAAHLLRAEIGGAVRLGCRDAADVDDDGSVGLDDAIALLAHLFLGAPAPPHPRPPAPGPDPTCDSLDCADSPESSAAIVISEIQYNPPLSQLREFIELHNRTAGDVDIGGWELVDGVRFTFPEGSVVPAGGRLLLVKTPDSVTWRDTPHAGPFAGTLANGGERLTLVDGPCVVETVRYEDRAPWPAGADGYGPSLERIDPALPASDHHSWRASLASRGSPGEASSVAGTPPRPLLAGVTFAPERPASRDEVRVSARFDIDAAAIASVAVLWEVAGGDLAAPIVMVLDPSPPPVGAAPEATYTAALPAQPSRSLVRMVFRVELASGAITTLPHAAEPAPFASYMVHDGDVSARLPILWLFPARSTGLVDSGARFSGVAVLEPGGEQALFDGARLRNAENGIKITFLKGAEYRGDRTLNVIPETGGGGTGGMAPHMEHLGFRVFRELGALAPRADWFRVIDAASGAQTQRLVIQQVNERFFEMNGIDPAGDLYKLDKSSFAKKTNPETGSDSLFALLRELRSTDGARRRAAVLDLLDADNVRAYSTIGMLIENWDGFHNNLYLYHDLSAAGRWIVVPWDLDQVFEPCCFDFPLTWPLDGMPLPGAAYDRSREPGPISRPYHLEPDLDELYRTDLREAIRPDGRFTLEHIGGIAREVEALLLDDLAILEAQSGAERPARRQQIRSAYAAMRRYLELRLPYLRSVLGE